MPVLSISYPLRHEQRSGPVHTPLMQPLINQIKFLNRNCHNKMECGTKEQLVEMLTFHKSVSKSNFVECILVGIRIVPVQHILHNHSHLYILERKYHPLSVHSPDYMNMCSVRCSCLYHMVDCKLVHRIFSICLEYNLACRHKYHLYIHHFHNL